jgi:hypothetical protein
MPHSSAGTVKAHTRALAGKLLDKLPYVSDLRKMLRETGQYSPGHFYSPVPSQAEVLSHIEATKEKKEPADIQLNHDVQFGNLQAFEKFYGELPFPEKQNPSCRYHYDQSVFCYPDAIFLYSFLRHTAPARIIEVGSGFSSAVILDTVERFFPSRPELTFIEPYPGKLNQLLRPTDRNTVRVIEKKLQDVPAGVFESLQAGDFLFIDSSHVLKCGSDLYVLFFEVMPRLRAGVYLHFHDIFYPFDYPEDWLRKGVYWNEAYFLRAFLSNNNAWEIYFFNNYVRTHFENYLAEKMALCLKNIGGSLYLQKRN